MTLQLNGPGRYDDLCTYVKQTAKARGAIVIIMDGEHGVGFSAQLDTLLAQQADIPAMLRHVADQMEGKCP